jgi:hypothetical protein
MPSSSNAFRQPAWAKKPKKPDEKTTPTRFFFNSSIVKFTESPYVLFAPSLFTS